MLFCNLVRVLALASLSFFSACGGGNGSAGTTANAAPVANAGTPQSVVAGALVTLNGSTSSDANGDPLTYNWSLTSKPTGSSATLSSATSALPTFTADIAGTYAASLVVNDGQLNSNIATVSVTAAAVTKAALVANAGLDQFVPAGETVNLSGAASSDANGYTLTYSWALISKPAGSGANLSSSAKVTTSFIADLVGSYVVELTVNNGKSPSVKSTVNIEAIRAGTPSLGS